MNDTNDKTNNDLNNNQPQVASSDSLPSDNNSSSLSGDNQVFDASDNLIFAGNKDLPNESGAIETNNMPINENLPLNDTNLNQNFIEGEEVLVNKPNLPENVVFSEDSIDKEASVSQPPEILQESPKSPIIEDQNSPVSEQTNIVLENEASSPVENVDLIDAAPNLIENSTPDENLRRNEIFKSEGIISETESPVENVPPMPASPIEEEKSSLPFVFKIFAGFLALMFFILLIFFINFLFFSHNGNNTKITLIYWGLWEDPNIMQGVISDFERTHPKIIIKYEKQDPNQYSARLITRIQNGTGPDIFRFHNSWVPMLLPLLSPLPNSVINPADFKQNYYPVIVSDLDKNGAIYGLPLDIDTLALFTNDKLLQSAGVSAPKTWNDFINASRLLTVKDQNNKIQTAGASFGTYDNITHAPDVMSLLFIQNGVNFNNFSNTLPNASDALTFYTSFANSQSGVNTNINVWDNTLPSSIKYFSAGKVALYFGYSWDIFTIQALNPTLSFSVHPVPSLPGVNTTIASYWVEGISDKSKYQKEADEFLAFLSKKETLQKLYSSEAQTRPFGELYPRMDMADLLKSNTLIYPFLAQAKNATSSYFSGETFDGGINAQMNGYLANAINSVFTNNSSQTAIGTLSKGVSQVLFQYSNVKQK